MRPLLLSLSLAMFALADWSNDPAEPLHLGTGIDPHIDSTSDGGAYIAWLSPGNFHIYLQRLDSLGNPQWAEGGVLVSDAPNNSWIAVYHLNLEVDNENNAILSAVDTRTGNWEVYIYKLDPDGNQLWGEDGLALSSNGTNNISPRIALEVSDNSIVVTWSDNFTALRLQRISAEGSLLWGENGIVVSAFNTSLLSPQPAMSSDGHLLVQAIRQTGNFPAVSSQMMMQKYTLSGNAVWSSWTQIGTEQSFPMGNWLQDLSPDTQGGAYTSWTEMTSQNQTGKVQHLLNDGEESWESTLELSTESSHFRISPRLARCDVGNGVYAVWGEADANQNNRGVVAQRVDNNGLRLWGDSGTAIEPLSGHVFYDIRVADWDDDLLVAYTRESSAGGQEIMATRLDTSASFRWENPFVQITNSGGDKAGLNWTGGPNCTILTWSENGSIMAHCLSEEGHLGLPLEPPGQRIHVPEDYATIQAAIQASSNGDTILVQPGTYYENINYSGKSIVVASHRLTTGDDSFISRTIIDASGSGTVVTMNSGEGLGTELNGFTIQNGVADRSDPDGDGDSSSYGGGVLCTGVNPKLRNLMVVNNSALNGGGGGMFFYASNPIIENTTFLDNSSQDVGGAIYAKSNCEIIINDAIFTGNNCPSVGAAIYVRDTSGLFLNRVLMANNISDHAGGGIGMKADCQAVLTHVTITQNFALHHGAGLYSNNSQYQVINSILWGNSGGEVYFADFDDPSELILSHSTIQDSSAGITTNDNGDVIWLEGNLDQDPLISAETSPAFALNLHSPGVDTGTDLYIWEGDTLLHLPEGAYEGSAPDMGVHELIPEIVNYLPLYVNSGWVLASEIDTMIIVIIDSSIIEGNQYYSFDPEYPYYPNENIEPLRVDGNQVKVWTGETDEILYDIAVPLNTTWAFTNPGVWEYSEISLMSYGETIETAMGTYENCYGFHRFIGADYEYYDWVAPGAGLVQRDVITFAGPRRYTLIDFLIPVDIEDQQELVVPQDIQLVQNYPNPFNPSTTIQYRLPSDSKLSLKVFDVNGREVTTLYQGWQQAGSYALEWQGLNLQGEPVNSGVYFCVLSAEGNSQTIKMIYLK